MALQPDRFADAPAMLIAGIRRTHDFSEAEPGIGAQWRSLHALDPLPNTIEGAAYGVIGGSDMERQTLDYLCGVEVTTFDGLPEGVDRMRIPAAHYAVFHHDGPVTELRALWQAIWSDWLPRSGRTPAPTPDFERYNPDFEEITASGTIEIWFPIEKTS